MSSEPIQLDRHALGSAASAEPCNENNNAHKETARGKNGLLCA